MNDIKIYVTVVRKLDYFSVFIFLRIIIIVGPVLIKGNR